MANSNKNSWIDVRCGKQPDRDDLKWTFTTGDIRNFLNGQLRYVTSNLRIFAEKNKKDPGQIPDVETKVLPVKIGENFVPFLIKLPDSVLEDNKYDPSIPPTFRTKNKEGLRMKKPYWHLISSYMYDNEDKKDFRSSRFRNHQGIRNGRLWEMFRRHISVSIDSTIVDDEEKRYIILFVDPRRIFKKMLEDQTKRKQRFRPIIKSYKQLDESSWTFEVMRQVIRKNDDNNDADSLHKLIKEMMRK